MVAGPVSLSTPYGVERTDVRSALQMHAAVMAQVDSADVFIATAAVADWRPAQVAGEKIKKAMMACQALSGLKTPTSWPMWLPVPEPKQALCIAWALPQKPSICKPKRRPNGFAKACL